MRENRPSGSPTRSDTNRSVESQKKVRILKFQVEVKRNCTIRVAKTNALIRFTVTSSLSRSLSRCENVRVKIANQRTNGPVNAHLRSGICDLS